MSEANKPKGSRLDASMRAALLGVIGSAVVLTVGAYAVMGRQAAQGVAIGGGLAAINLLVFAVIGEAVVARRGRTSPWAAVGMLKLVALLGVVWLILRSGIASGLSLAVGYGALPMGITLGSLFGPKPPEEGTDTGPRSVDESEVRRSFGDAPGKDVLKARPPDAGDPPPSER
ncbi:ATP synthase subunit I [Polyangium aurulentum]|uniref:ATP synthase subunit I n=1 Tax=Polyangium aurulentum TaxID=2567896 RepID=UPI0010ADEFC3|nr:ATP synthase subunit I [Polyangium aurulentum]UQA60995.1 ATP synthase subunit I [Polyangium aurulentum]